MPSLVDPYAVDRTPRITFTVGGKVGAETFGESDVTEITGYSYTTDILTLTDSATIEIANPNGINTTRIPRGAPFRLYMADPNVNGGAKTLRLTGIVVNPKKTSRGGCRITVEASDRGWFLDQCDGPLWLNLAARHTFGDLLSHLLKGPQGQDLGWGFQNADGSLNVSFPSDPGMGIYTKLSQGRAGIERTIIAKANKGKDTLQLMPPIQIETGTKIGGIIVDYARRIHRLVNVASDGTLIVWQPNYKQDPSFHLHYHADTDTRRTLNNVLSVDLDDSADGIPSEVDCVTRLVYSSLSPTPEDPNVDKVKGLAHTIGEVPYFMRATFGDENQIGQTMANTRALWYAQRKMYDAWTYTVEVFGHSREGLFYAPDTMCSVDDTINNVVGNYYVSACKYVRDQGGTRTILTIKRPGLLAA